MVAYGVQMATMVSDNRYDLVVKSQGQIYLKYVLQLVKRARLSFLVKVVHILYM